MGRVTMDMSVVDVSHVPGAAVGDEVVLLGGQGNARVDAVELVALMDTLHYEVRCGVGARVC
jgi:alanine racemase